MNMKGNRNTGEMLSYSINEIRPYINWIYFFHAWGFQPKYAAAPYVHTCEACRTSWVASFPIADQPKALEALRLHEDADKMLYCLESKLTVQSLFRLYPANSDGNDILIASTRLPLLRQQTPHPDGSPFLCLSDFIRPLSQGQPDTIGVFASTVQSSTRVFPNDPYKQLLVQTLSDRLVEAATEKMHLYVRTQAWGYAPHEDLSLPDLLAENYQGIRPAVGYPSLPDQSINFLLDKLLDMKQIGITLTSNGAMHPHASICGLMFAHPEARYFSIGKIGIDQLNDYAHRRGLSVESMRKFLAKNL